MNIYVMDRGFVLVGEPQPESLSNALFVTLNCCGVVRRWGTTKGLGELAANGPLRETVIDREPDGVEIAKMHTFRVIPCDKRA